MEKFEQWLALLSEKRSQDKSYNEHSMKGTLAETVMYRCIYSEKTTARSN